MTFDTSDIPASPLEFILRQQDGTELYIKRDDLVHPIIEGNKWRKLKYNIIEVLQKEMKTIISVGGAYSNHLLALSQAGKYYQFQTKGFVYGDYVDVHNFTLSSCRKNGMEIVPLSKKEFLHIKEEGFSNREYEYFVPEGGSNNLSFIGTGELYAELIQQMPDLTHIVLPFGSGGTTAGIYQASLRSIEIIAIPVLKLNPKQHLLKIFHRDFDALKSFDEYHFGGYAKFNQTLLDFITSWYEKYSMVVDPIYNGKALFGLIEKLSHGYFPPYSKIAYIHTGGSQGIVGFNRRFNLNLPEKGMEI